jgi:taurine dioxygenase
MADVATDVPGATALCIEPVTGVIGALVSGVDLRHPLREDVKQELEHALHEYGVLFFHHQPLTDTEQKEFARQFGELWTKTGRPDPEVSVIDSDTIGYRTAHWHTDEDFHERPPTAGVLRGVVLPPGGGDTLWASMYAAYEALSSRMQRLLDELDAQHAYTEVTSERPSDRPGFPVTERLTESTTAVHPAVITDRLTKRRALYVTRHTVALLGVSESESNMLLRFLAEHIRSPEFQVRFQWEPDAVAFWEERVTQHRVIPDQRGRRIVHRVTIRGDRPS